MMVKYIFDKSSTISELAKKFREAKAMEAAENSRTKISMTFLANFSTQFLVNSIFTSMVFNGISPDILESSYDQWEFELNNSDSATYRRNSDFLCLMLTSSRLVLNPVSKDTKSFTGYLRKLLLKYRQKCSSKIIVVLPEYIREGLDQTSPFHLWVKALRADLQNELKDIVIFFDINPLIMEFGFEKWHSPKYLISSKLCCHPNCFPLYGDHLSSFIRSLVLRPTRLIITDLDDTLWRGVVGDLGAEGVGLDQEGNGYPHLMLQNYLWNLKGAGVLLAICSKNTFEVAERVFSNRREMILKLDDFVAHEINWRPKSENIRKILADLNLTASGILFLDDSKFEREEVRNNFPEINVPELPEGPEHWCEFLAKSGLLTIGHTKEEDLQKSQMYYAEKMRKEESLRHTDYSDFLHSLDLTLSPQRISPANFDRVYELIHKTNQFNLTTKRLSRLELEQLTSNPANFCVCYGLKDKFSDYGIISIFIAVRLANEWVINTWLMSCRTMGRGVENAVFDHFLTHMLEEGDTVVGEYSASEKNTPVADLLDRMGFSINPNTSMNEFTVGANKNPKVGHIRFSKLD